MARARRGYLSLSGAPFPAAALPSLVRGFEDRYLIVAPDAVEQLLASLGVPRDLR